MVQIHRRVHERHPELDVGDVEAAWENYRFAAVRVPGEQEMRTGYDPHGGISRWSESSWLTAYGLSITP